MDKYPALSDSLPAKTADGVVWEEILVYCGKCDQKIQGGALRGIATEAFGVIMVEGAGVCELCSAVSKFNFRIKKDNIFEIINNNGEWTRGHIRFSDVSDNKAKLIVRCVAKIIKIKITDFLAEAVAAGIAILPILVGLIYLLKK